MKIQCTKDEWFWMDIFLNSVRSTSTNYKFPEFTCTVTDCEGEITFEIEGTFTDSEETTATKG